MSKKNDLNVCVVQNQPSVQTIILVLHPEAPCSIFEVLARASSLYGKLIDAFLDSDQCELQDFHLL